MFCLLSVKAVCECLCAIRELFAHGLGMVHERSWVRARGSMNGFRMLPITVVREHVPVNKS
jgi:hypothetical protein